MEQADFVHVSALILAEKWVERTTVFSWKTYQSSQNISERNTGGAVQFLLQGLPCRLASTAQPSHQIKTTTFLFLVHWVVLHMYFIYWYAFYSLIISIFSWDTHECIQCLLILSNDSNVILNITHLQGNPYEIWNSSPTCCQRICKDMYAS